MPAASDVRVMVSSNMENGEWKSTKILNAGMQLKGIASTVQKGWCWLGMGSTSSKRGSINMRFNLKRIGKS